MGQAKLAEIQDGHDAETITQDICNLGRKKNIKNKRDAPHAKLSKYIL